MKRFISAVLSACIMLSLIGTGGFSFAVPAENPMQGTEYSAMFDSTSDVYGNTFVISPQWQTDSAVEGETDMQFVFSGVTITEKYDKARHFASYDAAAAAFESRYIRDGALTKEIAAAVPSFILAAGTYGGDITVRYSANIYGAKAGINPNDPDFDISAALPTDAWNANPERSGSEGETVISGTVLRSNKNGSSASDLKYEQPLKDAGVTGYTLNIDGVKFTGTTAVLSNDLTYNVGLARTNAVNVYNTIFNGVNYGLSADGDTSRNFNDYTLRNIRVTGLKSDGSGALIRKYPRTVSIEGMNFEQNAGGLYIGGTASNTNDLWWTNCGGARGVSFTVKGSRFADNSVYTLGNFTDNCYLPSLNLTFESSIFKDTTSGKWGIFRADTFSGSGYPTLKLKFTNNTFYGSPDLAYNTILNGNANYQKAAFDIEFNYNRVIGYKSMFMNITSDMDTWLSGCNWSYDNNYVADTFVSADDELGKKPEYLTNSATVNPVNLNSLEYFFDYKMMVGNASLKITGADFEDKVEFFSINNKNLSVSAMLDEGVVIENPKFTASSESAEIGFFEDADKQIPVTSISYDDLGDEGKRVYYLTVTYKNIVIDYLVTFTAKGDTFVFANRFDDPAGVIDKTAALLMNEDGFASGTEVTKMWQNQLWSFTVGVNAFSSVEEARAAGITQMILPAGEYDSVSINGSVELYGEGYAENPNSIPDDRTKEWALSDSWRAAEQTQVANISVEQSATPRDDSGTQIVIKGINLTGRFIDDKRAVSEFKTSVLLENNILGFNRTVSGVTYIFALNNANAQSTDNTVKNIDEFTVKNSRYEFENNSASLRLFAEICPASVTLDGIYFGSGFITLGYPKWRNCVDNGTLEVSSCYFKEYSRSKDMVIALCGHADQCDSTGKTTRAVFRDNVLIDCFNSGHNANSNVAVNIFPGAFTSIDIADNTFIDTQNRLGNILKVQSSAYSPNTSDFSDKISFTGNRVIGLAPFVTVNDATAALTSCDGNYYARYTEDYASAYGSCKLYGVLKNGDCYLDYQKTTKASELDMVIDRELSMVNNETREASVVIGENERYIPKIKSSNGKYLFHFFEDENCCSSVGTLTRENVGSGRAFWAKAVSPSGVSVVYKVYVSVGSFDAKAPDTVGDKNIENPYLFYLGTEDMPVGTVFTMPWQGEDYIFTAGKNAFASISQIINCHEQNSQGTPNVILPSGIYSDEIVVTKTVNIYGENSDDTVLKNEPNTKDAIKIACVGDSITEGIGIDAAQRPASAYPAQLQTILDERYGQGSYNVGNFGWGGSTINVQTNRETTSYTYWTYIYSVQYYKSLDFNPDIVVIMMGHNDTHTQLYSTAEGYKAQYQALIDSYEALPSHPTVVIAGCTSRTASIRRDLLLETIIPMQKELAADNGLIYIDMFSPTNGKEGDKTLFTDGLHCTAAGYNMLATLIANGMEPILGTERAVTTADIKIDADVSDTPESKIKVACIGDSLTYGDKAYKGYPVYLGEMLGDRYEVRNFGECGAIACDESTLKSGTNWCYKNYERYTQSKAWKPDIVILMLGYNDAGGHLTDFHSVNWTGGENSTAAAEFEKDYKALVQEYTELGAQVYIVNTPCSNNASDKNGTSNQARYINPIIERTASELELPFVDIHSFTKPWGTDMYCGTNSAGTTDNTHMSAKGYEAMASFMFDSIFSVFADSYCDDLGEISSSAVIVDLQAPEHQDGDIVSYAWEGEDYQFVWGENAFANIDDAINSANAKGSTSLQALIPENSHQTSWEGDFIITADTTNIKSLEVFGINRRFDPNDKSAASSDPTADWTLNPDWDMYARNGGTSAMNRITFNCNDDNNNVILSGKVKFKGITMRNIVWNSERKEGTAENPRNLNLIFENVLVDFTAASGSGGYLFNLNSPRSNSKTFAADDSLTLRNFRIEKFLYKSGKNRIMGTYGPNNITLDGFYYNGDRNELDGTNYPLAQFGWIQTSPAAKSSEVYILNSNFRNDNVAFNTAPISNAVAANNTPSVYEIKNNVFYNVSGAIVTFPKYYTAFAVEDNYFIQPDGTKSFITNNGSHTDQTVNYNETIGYSARNNMFVLADLSKYSPITLNSVTAPGADLTGSYVAQYTDDYKDKIAGTAPAVGQSDYFYTDFIRSVKNTDLEIVSLGACAYAEKTEIAADTVTLTATGGQVIDDTSVICKNKNITTAVFADEQLTQPAKRFELPANETGKTYWIKLSYGEFSKVYRLEFLLGTAPAFAENYTDINGIVKNTAVALLPAADGLEDGTQLTARWNGTLYSFTAGQNAFASMEAIYEKLPDEKLQVILPAGKYTKNMYVYGSWEVYGEGYAVNPNNTEGKDRSFNEGWSKNGETVLENANLVIAKEATPETENGTEITVASIRLTKYINDAQRTQSPYKTTVTLKNNVYERKYLTGAAREFDLRCENNVCQDDEFTNIDEFNIVNLHYINSNPSNQHAMFQELVAPFMTIDGLCIAGSCPTIGYPKVTKAAKETSFTLKNSYFKELTAGSARFAFIASFSGHDQNVASADRTGYKSALLLENNKFISCGNESTGGDTQRFPVQIFPQSYNDISIIGNDVISPADGDYKFIDWATISYSVNSGDYSDRIEFAENRLIGVMPSVYVNSDTELDLSGNYFAKYTSDYDTAALGDIPADTDADFYLDFGRTVKLSDTAPRSDSISGFSVLPETKTAYGYAEDDISDFGLSNSHGTSYTVYSDKACTLPVTTLTVESGSASVAYIKAANGSVSTVYTLYIIGVDNISDISAEVDPQQVDGIETPSVYYPSLYGAPDGIVAVARYGGKPYGFTTGSRVVSNVTTMAATSTEILLPDSITEFNETVISGVSLHSAESAVLAGIRTRKMKIAAVGDSITQGVGAGSTTSYPAQLQKYLGTDQFEVKNFGKSAATVQIIGGSAERGYKEFAKTEYEASLAYEPDVVIFALGTNDVYASRWDSNTDYANEYIELIRTYQQLPSKPAVYITTALKRADNLMMNERVEQNLINIQEYVAGAVGGKVIDTHAYMAPFLDGTTTYFGDNLHPTAQGYTEMSSFIGRELLSDIKTFDSLSFNGMTVTGRLEAVSTNTEISFTDCEILLTEDGKCTVDADSIGTLNIDGCIFTDENSSFDFIDAGRLIDFGGDEMVLSDQLRGGTDADGLVISSTSSWYARKPRSTKAVLINAVIPEKETSIKDAENLLLDSGNYDLGWYGLFELSKYGIGNVGNIISVGAVTSGDTNGISRLTSELQAAVDAQGDFSGLNVKSPAGEISTASADVYWNDDEQKFCTKYTLSDVPAGDTAYTLMWIVYIDRDGNEVLSCSMLDATLAK